MGAVARKFKRQTQLVTSDLQFVIPQPRRTMRRVRIGWKADFYMGQVAEVSADEKEEPLESLPAMLAACGLRLLIAEG